MTMTNYQYFYNLFKLLEKPMALLFTLFFVFTATLSLPIKVEAIDLTVSLPQRPGIAEKGPNGEIYGSLVDLIIAIDNEYIGGKIIILGIYPFQHSIKNVIDGNADFHPIMIKDKNPEGFVYSSERIAVLSDVLYTNSDKPRLDMGNLWKYRIDVGRGHANFFRKEFLKSGNKPPANINEVDRIMQGLLKVAFGRIDGFLMDMDSADSVLRKLRLKNIRRELYERKDVHAIVPLGPRGKEVDKILTKALGKLREKGHLKKLVYNLHKPWKDWQPYEKDW